MMTPRQAAFRNDYRTRVSPWYSGIGLPYLAGRLNNVAADLDRARHAAKNVDRLIVERDQLGDRLAAFGDDERHASLRDLVHQPQAVRLEVRRAYMRKVFIHARDPWSSLMVI